MPKVYRRGNAFWPTFVIGGADSSGPKGVTPRYFRKNDSYYQLLNGTILDLVYNTYTMYSKPFYCRVARRVCLNGELYSASMPGIKKNILVIQIDLC